MSIFALAFTFTLVKFSSFKLAEYEYTSFENSGVNSIPSISRLVKYKSSSSSITFPGFSSSSANFVTFISYVLVVFLSSAVTTIFMLLLDPTSNPEFPVIFKLAFESSVFATTFSESTFAGTVTLYLVLFLLNPEKSYCFGVTPKVFKFAFDDFVVLLLLLLLSLVLVDFDFTATFIVQLPSIGFSSVSLTSTALIVIIALPASPAVTVIVFSSGAHTDDVLTFATLVSEDFISNFPSQSFVLILNII